MGTLVKQSTLSKQASDVFHMTLDELQQTCGSGKPFGSMNMVRTCLHCAFTVCSSSCAAGTAVCRLMQACKQAAWVHVCCSTAPSFPVWRYMHVRVKGRRSVWLNA